MSDRRIVAQEDLLQSHPRRGSKALKRALDAPPGERFGAVMETAAEGFAVRGRMGWLNATAPFTTHLSFNGTAVVASAVIRYDLGNVTSQLFPAFSGGDTRTVNSLANPG